MKNLNGNDLNTNDLATSYNLLDEPWIPVETLDGRARKLGLREFFERLDEIRDFATPPAQRIALTRLALCVAHAALDGPNHRAELRAARSRIQSAAVEYLEKWRDRFDLWGEKPFLQTRDVTPTPNAKTDKLDFALAAGNNSSLLDNEVTPEGRAHSDAWLALQLLTYQQFSPGGLTGVAVWNGTPTAKACADAPAGEGSMLHGLLIGDAALDTIWANLICRDQLDGVPWGRPVWELDLKGTTSDKEIVTSYLGRLVAFSRCLLLNANRREMTVADGITYPKLGPGVRDPFGTTIPRSGKVKPDETPYFYLRTDGERAPWRNLNAILVRKTDSDRRGLFALENLDVYLESKETSTFRLWTGGVAFDKAKILDALSWSFSIDKTMLGDKALAEYEAGVERAKNWENRLAFAVKEYRSALGCDPDLANKTAAQAKKVYWAALDSVSDALADSISGGGEEGEVDVWGRTLKDAALSTFRQFCPRLTPRQYGAYARGERTLFKRSNSKKEKKADKKQK